MLLCLLYAFSIEDPLRFFQKVLLCIFIISKNGQLL